MSILKRCTAAQQELKHETEIYFKSEDLTKSVEDECNKINQVVEAEFQAQENKNAANKRTQDIKAQQAHK